jgi:hypothetical protein
MHEGARQDLLGLGSTLDGLVRLLHRRQPPPHCFQKRSSATVLAGPSRHSADFVSAGTPSGRRTHSIGALAVTALVVATAACGSRSGAGPTGAKATTLSFPPPYMSPGARVDASAVEAALASAAAAGPATFRTAFGLAAPSEGYSQTMTQAEGTLDLGTSRGIAVEENLPALSASGKYEKALVGNQAFIRAGEQAGWQKSSGGARAFLGLDVAGDSALVVIEEALPAGPWVVVTSEPLDPPGSIRIEPETPVEAEVSVVIDASGRLISIRRSVAGESRPGRLVHELGLLSFGVAFESALPS